MINFDNVTKENMKKHNLDKQKSYSFIQNVSSWRFTIQKTNSLFNLISQQTDNENILYAENPYEAKYQFPINTRESTALKHLNGSKAFIEYQNK